MIEKKIKNNKGYTLLFAVLVASIVLSVGISILTISKKEFLLSSAARESITAFYSADGGLECAILHDNDGVFIGDSTDPSQIVCMGNQATKFDGFGNAVIGTNTFHIKMNDNTNACAIVTVQKDMRFDNELGQNIPVTIIESRGYNLGWIEGADECSQNSVRRVERAIRYSY